MSLSKVMEALEAAQAGLEWYRDRCPEAVDGSDDEATTLIDEAIAILREHIGEQGQPSAWHLMTPEGNVAAVESSCVRAWARIRGYKPTVEGLLGFEEEGWRVVPAPPVDQAPTQGDSHV